MTPIMPIGDATTQAATAAAPTSGANAVTTFDSMYYESLAAIGLLMLGSAGLGIAVFDKGASPAASLASKIMMGVGFLGGSAIIALLQNTSSGLPGTPSNPAPGAASGIGAMWPRRPMRGIGALAAPPLPVPPNLRAVDYSRLRFR
jgi:hypothetical protein